MSRISSIISAAAFIAALSLSNSALADDKNSGFGESFAGKAAIGFEDSDTSDADIAEGLNTIAPAAGDPAEEELERKFNTDVTHTELQRGGELNETRDRLGDGEVGIFLEHESDDRINDGNDAIGVQFDLLEFE